MFFNLEHSSDTALITKEGAFTYAQLKERSDFLVHGLAQIGVQPQQKALLLMQPTFDCFALLLALLKIGAIPAIMPKISHLTSLLDCAQRLKPDIFVADTLAHIVRLVCGKPFRTVKININTTNNAFIGRSLASLKGKNEPFDSQATFEAICFSNSFRAITVSLSERFKTLQSLFPLTENDIFLAHTPQAALFAIAHGACAVIPPNNATSEEIIEIARQYHVSTAFGTPSVWKEIAAICQQRRQKLSELKRLVLFGAPAPNTLQATILFNVLEQDADVHSVYMTAETGPIAVISASQTLSLPKHDGICVGKPIVKLEPLEGVAEIVVSGKRTNDLGALKDGNLWLFGRINDTIETAPEKHLYPLVCETAFNAIQGIRQSALTGIGSKPNQIPVIVAEPTPEYYQELSNAPEKLLAEAHKAPSLQQIRNILFKHKLPMDDSGNIDRRELANWATLRIK